MGGRGGSGGGKGGASGGGGGGGASSAQSRQPQIQALPGALVGENLAGLRGEFLLNGQVHSIGSKLDESLAEFAKERRDAANARRRAARAAKAKGQ